MTKTCAHCGARFEVGGSLTIGDTTYPLCHPNTGPDCYRLVTVYGEPIGSRGGDVMTDQQTLWWQLVRQSVKTLDPETSAWIASRVLPVVTDIVKEAGDSDS